MCMHYSIRLSKKKDAVISVLFQSDKVHVTSSCWTMMMMRTFYSQPEKGDHGNDVFVDGGGSGSKSAISLSLVLHIDDCIDWICLGTIN